MNEKRPDFIVDAMLGNLARKLRVLGFDSKYSSSIEDKMLIDLATKEGRIIITKDEGLIKNAEKTNIPTILIRGSDETDQIIQIATKMNLSNFVMDANLARCVSCNGRLELVEKSRIANKIPSGVYDRQNQFWICTGCQKIYWEGTHFKKLQEFVARLNQRLK